MTGTKSNAEEAGEWRQLFNGEDLSGWEMTGPGEFKVEDGALATYGGMGLLWYPEEKFGNVELKVVYKETGPEDNSGVFIRIAEPPKNPWYAVNQGYEVQIDQTDDEWHRTGVLYSFTRAEQEVPPDEDGWNTMLIRLEGDRTRVWVNDVLLTDFTEGDPVPPKKALTEPARGARPEYGYIGLQNHDDDSRVLFKEISVRPLKEEDAAQE